MKSYRRPLIFTDTHFPYEHPKTFEFLQEVRDTYNPDVVIHGGDLCDIYSISLYPNDIDHPDSWHDEIKKARKRVQRLAKIFPDLMIVESNHDDRAYKKARVSGISREFMMPYAQVMGAPDTWTWYRDIRFKLKGTKGEVFVAHHKAGGALAVAKDLQCHAVLGHKHTEFGIVGFKATDRVVYGIDAGCLISDEGAPYSYNKLQRGRPIRGCVIFEDGVPKLIPLD